MRAPEGFSTRGAALAPWRSVRPLWWSQWSHRQLTPAKIEVLLCPQHSKLQSAEPFMFDHFSRIRAFADRARHEKPKTKPLKTSVVRVTASGGQEFGPYQRGGTRCFSLRHDEADCTDRWNHGQPVPEAELRGWPRGQHHSCPDNHWRGQTPKPCQAGRGCQETQELKLIPEPFPGLVGSYPYNLETPIYTPRKTRGLHSLKRISDLLGFSEKTHREPKAGFQPLVFLGGLHPGKKQHILHPKS